MSQYVLQNQRRLITVNTHFDNICKYTFKNTSVFKSEVNPFIDPRSKDLEYNSDTTRNIFDGLIVSFTDKDGRFLITRTTKVRVSRKLQQFQNLKSLRLSTQYPRTKLKVKKLLCTTCRKIYELTVDV